MENRTPVPDDAMISMARAWLRGQRTDQIARNYGVSEAEVYNRLGTIKATAHLIRRNGITVEAAR